jgi:hypothetical protein
MLLKSSNIEGSGQRIEAKQQEGKVETPISDGDNNHILRARKGR